jgi:hypothetical protein
MVALGGTLVSVLACAGPEQLDSAVAFRSFPAECAYQARFPAGVVRSEPVDLGAPELGPGTSARMASMRIEPSGANVAAICACVPDGSRALLDLEKVMWEAMQRQRTGAASLSFPVQTPRFTTNVYGHRVARVSAMLQVPPAGSAALDSTMVIHGRCATVFAAAESNRLGPVAQQFLASVTNVSAPGVGSGERGASVAATLDRLRAAQGSQPRPVAAPAAAGIPAGPIEGRLSELQRLRARGLITPSEYDAARARILRDL